MKKTLFLVDLCFVLSFIVACRLIPIWHTRRGKHERRATAAAASNTQEKRNTVIKPDYSDVHGGYSNLESTRGNQCRFDFFLKGGPRAAYVRWSKRVRPACRINLYFCGTHVRSKCDAQCCQQRTAQLKVRGVAEESYRQLITTFRVLTTTIWWWFWSLIDGGGSKNPRLTCVTAGNWFTVEVGLRTVVL